MWGSWGRPPPPPSICPHLSSQRQGEKSKTVGSIFPACLLPQAVCVCTGIFLLSLLWPKSFCFCCVKHLQILELVVHRCDCICTVVTYCVNIPMLLSCVLLPFSWNQWFCQDKNYCKRDNIVYAGVEGVSISILSTLLWKICFRLSSFWFCRGFQWGISEAWTLLIPQGLTLPLKATGMYLLAGSQYLLPVECFLISAALKIPDLSINRSVGLGLGQGADAGLWRAQPCSGSCIITRPELVDCSCAMWMQDTQTHDGEF